jgi:hypothetical protein
MKGMVANEAPTCGEEQVGVMIRQTGKCKGNLTDLRRILHFSLAKGNPK